MAADLRRFESLGNKSGAIRSLMSTRRYSYGDIARLVARGIEALPADGTPISSRSVFFALGEISTPAYVRIVLRQLAIAGHVIATGPSGQRVYQRLPAQQEVAADREQPVMAQICGSTTEALLSS